MHLSMAEDYLRRGRIGLAVSLDGKLPLEEQAHGAAVMLATATAAHVHATLAHLPESMVEELDAANLRADIAEQQLKLALDTVARQAWEMGVDAHPEVRQWARELMSQLDSVGSNIDNRVDEIADDQGYGTHVFDCLGSRFDLTRQHVDVKGKRWEHTGAWTPNGVPVMAREDKPEKVLDLPELAKTRGPLATLTRPEPGKRPTWMYSDEPPF